MTTEATSCPHVYRAITSVTAALAKEGFAKTKTNAQQGYKFRGIDDLYNLIASVLAANNLCMLPRVVSRDFVERTTKSGAVMNYTVLVVEFDLVSSIDGSKHTICTVGEAMDSADKSSNKAQSAAMKYACIVAFQIPTEGDNDADATTPEASRGKSASRVAPGGDVDAQTKAVDDVVAAYVERIERAADVKVLLTVYAECQVDVRIPVASKGYVTACLTAKRKALEAKAA